MRSRKKRMIINFFLTAFSIFTIECATDTNIENSLLQNELSYYSDTFDRMREDLWDKAGYLYLDEQMENFKLADMRFENGKLIIRTKTGSFSKGGLGSRFALRGNFDIQLDCRIDFIDSGADMDQNLQFLMLDKGMKIGAGGAAIIGIIKSGANPQGYIYTGYNENGTTYHRGEIRKIDNFHGTLRFEKKNNKINTLYRNMGETEWIRIGTFRTTVKDMMIGFKLQNFVNKRTHIQATDPITAEFDNFKITAAQKIIEEEI